MALTTDDANALFTLPSHRQYLYMGAAGIVAAVVLYRLFKPRSALAGYRRRSRRRRR